MHSKNVVPVADKEYDASSDASIELDEISANERRILSSLHLHSTKELRKTS